MLHLLKIWKCYADAIIDGRKNFEVRLNDRGYNAGDKIIFNEVCDCPGHPITNMTFEITYVNSGLGIKPNYVVFGIKKILDSNGVIKYNRGQPIE